MAKNTLYEINLDSPVSISREQYDAVGADDNILGDYDRGFYGDDEFEIWDSAVAGTQLIEGTDYTLGNLDVNYTERAQKNVYKTYKIINPVYQAVSIYITYECIGTYITTDIINDINTQITSLGGDIHAITTDYTVLDDDGYRRINVNPTSGALTVTFPTAADNNNRELEVFVTHAGGQVTIDMEGAEEIIAGPRTLTQIVLQSKGDKLIAYCDGTRWYAKELCSTISTGGVNTSDWTNRHLGHAVCTYDNLSAPFIVGETITEAVSGNTAIILADTGTVLTLKNATGTGIFTDGREITGGTSGSTADVNYPASTSKNVDTYILHNFGVPIVDLETELWIYQGTTFDEELAQQLSSVYVDGGSAAGYVEWGVDENNIKIQTAVVRSATLQDNGTYVDVDTDDWSYCVISRWRV